MEPQPEPFASITRLVSRFPISRDRAAIILVRCKWDEAEVNTYLSNGYDPRDFVDNPRFDYQVTQCSCCWNQREVCQNVGCGHYICNRCVLEHVTNIILTGGDLVLLCPFYGCGKYLPHEFMKTRVSELEYNIALTKSYEKSRQSTVKGRAWKCTLILVPVIVAAAWRIYKTR